MVGSVSIDINSPARSAAEALTCRDPSMHRPTTTSYPRSFTSRTATWRRALISFETPLDGEVTPIRSPGRRERGYRTDMRGFWHEALRVRQGFVRGRELRLREPIDLAQRLCGA
ncbi:hypothetical protein GCM10009646_33050 [Streptomyces aureus]